VPEVRVLIADDQQLLRQSLAHLLDSQPGFRVVAEAATGQLHLDAGGAGINTVFDDFFERGGGAFHHFAGGNLVHEVVGQGMDTGHDGSRGWPAEISGSLLCGVGQECPGWGGVGWRFG